MSAAFIPRQTENYLSVNWLEYFGENDLSAAVEQVQEIFRRMRAVMSRVSSPSGGRPADGLPQAVEQTFQPRHPFAQFSQTLFHAREPIFQALFARRDPILQAVDAPTHAQNESGQGHPDGNNGYELQGHARKLTQDTESCQRRM